MKNIIVFGFGWEGSLIYQKLELSGKYKMLGFADNSNYKQGCVAYGYSIKSIRELKDLQKEIDFSVVIASNAWIDIGKQLEENNIPIEGISIKGELRKYAPMTFNKINLLKPVCFYAGDICDDIHMSNPNLYGLSINKCDERHILHDITKEYPLPDNCIESYQAEDVLEHIVMDKLVRTINEIYRILKPGGLFRITLPDYNSPRLKRISMKDSEGNILYDPTGGGKYNNGLIENGGHIWFPTYENVSCLLEQTNFRNINYLCYHTKEEVLVRKNIDFSLGHILRIPKEKDNKKDIYSMAIDCYKNL